MSLRSGSMLQPSTSTRGHGSYGAKVLCVVIFVIALMQNPFGISMFVFGDWYYLMYTMAVFIFIIMAPYANGRYKYIFYSTKYLKYYFIFVFLSLICIFLNAVVRADIELIPTVRFIGRLFQFYIIYNLVKIIGVLSILRWMYRFSVVFSLLTVVFSLLNELEISNIFFNIAPFTDGHAMYYSFPYGFTPYLIPHSGQLQMSSYFTEASNYAYYLTLFLTYAGFKFFQTKNLSYFISIALLFTSIILTQAVAGYATLFIVIFFIIFQKTLSSISISNILCASILILLFFWVSSEIVAYFLFAEIEGNDFLFRRALSIELRIQEWMFSIREISTNPLGFGIGNVEAVPEALNSERVQGFGRGYGGPTNFLAPIYFLGIPYLLPSLFYGAVLLWCKRVKFRASCDLTMVSVMVVCGVVHSASYNQLNTAVFHTTLAAFFILLSQKDKDVGVITQSRR